MSGAGFAFDPEDLALPRGAWARTKRRRLCREGIALLGVTQGEFRNYLYPLLTPAGYPVTAERPADHPHHASLWLASDHVGLLVPGPGDTTEEYTYNFYVDEVFQGRAPGRIVEASCEGGEESGGFTIRQELDWLGPREWGAPEGRRVLAERRTVAVSAFESRVRIDVASVLIAPTHPVRFGPTRHAFFNIRIADNMCAAGGGVPRDDRGRSGGGALTGEGPRWVDFTGPVGGGAVAGVTVIPHGLAGRTPFWFVADWGIVSVGPFRHRALDVPQGASVRLGCTFLVHDGGIDDRAVEAVAKEVGEHEAGAIPVG